VAAEESETAEEPVAAEESETAEEPVAAEELETAEELQPADGEDPLAEADAEPAVNGDGGEAPVDEAPEPVAEEQDS
jgi:hypothetical protein